MRKTMTAVLMIAALAAMPAFAAQATSKPTEKPAVTKDVKTRAANHSTSGKVKSVDATTLVITKAGAKPQEMTFALDASTQKSGTIETGSDVTVRYHTEGKQNTATAVMARPAKPAPPKK